MLYTKGKKITRRITRRAVVFSRRVGLRAVMSTDTGVHRVKGGGRPRGRKGVIRTLLLLLMAGFIAYSAAERGVMEKVRVRVFPQDPMPLKRAVHAPKAPARGAMPWDRFLKGKKAPDYSRMKAVALSCRGRTLGLSAEGVVLPFSEESNGNLPIVSGAGAESLSVGDTLFPALPALELARTAMERSPGLYDRISEIALSPGGNALTLLFVDTKLKAKLRPAGLEGQLNNLRLFFRHPPLPVSGVLDMRFGNAAYLKEEE